MRGVNVNDFNRIEVAGGLGRKLGGQNRTDREVRGNQYAHAGVLAQQLAQGVQAFGGPAGRADHRVHAVLNREANVGLTRIRNGQVNHDFGAGVDQLLQVVTAAQGRHQVHILGGVDGANRLRPHAARGSKNRYLPNLLAHALSSLLPGGFFRGGRPVVGRPVTISSPPLSPMRYRATLRGLFSSLGQPSRSARSRPNPGADVLALGAI